MNKYNIAASILLMSCTAAFAGQADKDTMVTGFWHSAYRLQEHTGSVTQLGGADLENPSITDFRNRLTGLIPGLEVREDSGYGTIDLNQGSLSVSGGLVSVSGRGQSPICILDGVVVPLTHLRLEPNQVESISYVSDVADKAAFGPLASSGALLITTRKGGYNTPFTVCAEVESGLNTPAVLPEWTGGYDYAALNNLARSNSGYSKLYSTEALSAYSHPDAYDMTYPSVDYKSLMLSEFTPQTHFGLNFSGGSGTIKYNVSLNGQNNKDMFKVGAHNDTNALSLSTSITAKIGKWIETTASFIGSFGIQRMAKRSFSDWYAVPAVAFPLTISMDEDSEFYDSALMSKRTVYGASRTFPDNPYAGQMEGGHFLNRTRSGMFSATVNYNLDWLVKGLKSTTFASLDTYYYQQTAKTNDYIAYFWNNGALEELSSHKGVKTSGRTTSGTYTYQSLNLFERLSYNREWNGNRFGAGLVGCLSNSSSASNSYYQRQLYAVADVAYSYKGRYNLNAVLEYAGTSRFAKENRFAAFPAVGASWVLSNENFLKDSPVVTFLKLRGQAGISGDSDVFGTHYLYRSVLDYTSSAIKFGPGLSSPWFGNNSTSQATTNLKRLSNPDLGWCRIKELDLGVDATLWNRLDVMLNAYVYDRYDIITEIGSTYSQALIFTQLYANNDAELTRGMELGLSYKGNSGDFRYKVGGNAMTCNTIVEKCADNFFSYDYQDKVGTSSGSYWGLKCLGKFDSDGEIAGSPLYSSDTKVGDLKYEDMNGDGKIDKTDFSVIGNTMPKLSYSLYLDLSCRQFGLYVLGTGRAFYQIPMTSSYFWNGWDDANYSMFVRENAGGDYPSLSFEKSADNFVESDFWLRNGGYFKLQTVDLSYTFKTRSDSRIKGLRLDLRGGNLFTLTKVEYVDPESSLSGIDRYPLFRTITLGAKLTF